MRNTRLRGFARCWCAAPAARKATFSTRRWIVRRSSTTFNRSAERNSIAPPRSSATTSFTCSATEILACRPRRQLPPLSRSLHDEAVDRLVAILRAEHPQVVVTYPEDQGNYQHPDHLRVDITSLRSNGLVTPATVPELGAAWSVSKIY